MGLGVNSQPTKDQLAPMDAQGYCYSIQRLDHLPVVPFAHYSLCLSLNRFSSEFLWNICSCDPKEFVNR